MLILSPMLGFSQGISLDVVSPFGKMVDHHKDGINLEVLKLVWHGEVVLGGFKVILSPLAAGGFDLAEAAVVTSLELAFASKSQFCGGGKNIISPFQQVSFAHGAVADVLAPGLVDDHLHGADVVDAIEHINHPQAVAHQLRIAAKFLGGGTDRDSKAVLVVDNLCGAVRQNNAVGCAAAVWHPSGNAYLLLHEHLCIGAAGLGFGVFFHNKGSIAIGTGLHFFAVVAEIGGRVFYVPAQCPFHQIGAELMGICAFSSVSAGLVRHLGTEGKAGRAA